MKNKLSLKSVDKIVGKFLCSLLSQPQSTKNDTIEKIIVIRPGGIGDAVLLAPVVILLNTIYPHAHICILAEKRNAGILQLVPGVDEVLCYDCPSELYKALLGRYDLVIDTEQWYRLSAAVARLLRAPIKIGFDTNERRRMFTHSVPYFQGEYETESFSHLLAPLGLDFGATVPTAPFLFVPEAVSGKAADLLEPLNVQPFVAVFPGASIPERRWGADRFRRVAEMLSVFGIRVVVVGGKEDRQQGEQIVDGGLGLNLAGMTSLAETAAVIMRSSLLLSGDSGVLHIAVGLGKATISLFGPGRAKKWAPQGNRHIVINKGLTCSPCTTFGTTPPCPIEARCLRDITVDEVFNAVTMLLTSLGVIQSRYCKRDWIETA